MAPDGHGAPFRTRQRQPGAPPLRALGMALALATAIASAATGCAGEGDTDGAGAADGRYHPPPNGVRVSEASACDSLRASIIDQALELGCSATMRPCPELLRAEFQTACLQYDQGTVSGCVSYYAARSSCAELDPTGCALAAFAGSEPAGCPP